MTSDGLYDVNVKWVKIKKIKKYRVKVTDVTKAVGPVGSDAVAPPDPAAAKPMILKVKGKKCKTKFAGTVGSTYKVRVRALKGKKMGKWSKAVQITIEDHRAAGTVTITLPNSGSVKVGDKLTAAVGSADAAVTWQWYRVNAAGQETAIDGATKAEYTVQGTDAGYFLKVIATINTGDPANQRTAEAVTPVAVSSGTGGGTVVEKQPLTSDGLVIETEPVIIDGEVFPDDITTGDVLTATGVPEDADVTWQWYRVDAEGNETPIEGATKEIYTVQTEDGGCYLKAVATASTSDPKYEGIADGLSDKVLDLRITVSAMSDTTEIALTTPPRYAPLDPSGEEQKPLPVKTDVYPKHLQTDIKIEPATFDLALVPVDEYERMEDDKIPVGKISGTLKGYPKSADDSSSDTTVPTIPEPWSKHWWEKEISDRGNFLALKVQLPEGTQKERGASIYEKDSDSAPITCFIEDNGTLVIPVMPSDESGKTNGILEIFFAFDDPSTPTRARIYGCRFNLNNLTLKPVAESPD